MGGRKPGVWLSETAVAFACAGRASTETAIAFAGEKWVFLVRFSVALVMVVSAGAVQGRAVVMAVSCWPTSVPAEVSLVSTSPSGRVLCTKKFTLLGLMVGASAKKFALQGRVQLSVYPSFCLKGLMHDE